VFSETPGIEFEEYTAVEYNYTSSDMKGAAGDMHDCAFLAPATTHCPRNFVKKNER
jgi:hypothetical protein